LGKIKSPILKSPEKIVVHTIPDMGGSGKCKPYLTIINVMDFTKIWSNKESGGDLKAYKINDAKTAEITQEGIKHQIMIIDITEHIKLSSDLFFRIKNRGSFKNKLICRFGLNTSFIDSHK
jgi:hypothetical protein